MNLETMKNLIKESQFRNPTKGKMSFKKVIKELVNYRNEYPEFNYRIVVGTDSETRTLQNDSAKQIKRIDFVSVIAIHRVGRGGRYFWLRTYKKQNLEFRDRIYREATLSLALAQALLEQELENNHIPIIIGKSMAKAIEELKQSSKNNLNKDIILGNDLEIHVDIGNKGPTREMIKEITGMIRGSGFYVKIKPEAFAAANVADKYL